MVSRTISLREDAYERLKRLKGEDKSFTDVVLELTENEEHDFSDFIGADITVEWDTAKRGRERSEEDERRDVLLGQ